MKTIITYVAFDGKEFNDEDLCAKYEKCKKYFEPLKKARFFDHKGREKSLNSILSDEAAYIFMAYLPTEEVVKAFKDLWEKEGLSGTDSITKPGFYFYEDCMCEDAELWHMVDGFPEYIANKFDSYKTAKKIKEQLDNENGSL